MIQSTFYNPDASTKILNRNLKAILIFTLFLLSASAFAQLTINISTIPSNTPEDVNIYLASALSNWSPGDSNFILHKTEDKSYQIILNPDPGIIEFKFTKGSWSTVEGTEKGLDIPNRIFEYKGGHQTINLSIEGWKAEEIKKSTAAKNVSILKENFYIPQLKKERRIWVYLPPDYNTSDKRYAVLYMHDGQNLFDDKTSFSGEWEVDEMLNHLFENGDLGAIVIGIDNGGSSRINEYTPWKNDKYGGGQGDEYVDFIVETLKPYVDENYRTLPDRLHTGIMGSSLGGLISFYAAIEHQEVFGKAGVFSPSFWFSEEVYRHVERTEKKHDINFYFLGGEQESQTLIDEMCRMVNTLRKSGFKDSEIQMVTKPDGNHNEAFWAREFENSYLWLFR